MNRIGSVLWANFMLPSPTMQTGTHTFSMQNGSVINHGSSLLLFQYLSRYGSQSEGDSYKCLRFGTDISRKYRFLLLTANWKLIPPGGKNINKWLICFLENMWQLFPHYTIYLQSICINWYFQGKGIRVHKK